MLPEVLALALHPKGRLEVASGIDVASAAGWSELRVRWKIVELWRLDAAALLAMGDPGLIPWVPLTRVNGPPDAVFWRCREAIDRVQSEDERSNLLAVTQVLAGLSYNDPRLLEILGGRRTMIESPVLKELEAEWKAEAKAEDILEVLRARFGSVPEELEAAVIELRDANRLDGVLRAAAQAGTLERLQSHLR